jgi:tRNA modification GTPase
MYMMHSEINDTIVAISTPIGEGGIGIVRLSGKDALKIVDKIFVSKDNKRPSEFRTYTTHYGWIVIPRPNLGTETESQPESESQKSKVKSQKSKIIDEVILTVMRAPKSYTKEDIVEINCHSGIVPLRKILDLTLKLGARLAQPGEFTKRAYLNGRIDLAQAEAVLDIVRSKTEASLRVALNQLEGNLSSQIKNLRDEVLELLACVEAKIDFPEEDIQAFPTNELLKKIKKIKDKLGNLLATADNGLVLKEGITTVICGRPNVGKSSLLNALLKQNRAIVTPIPGTTRDTIEEILNIEGIPLCIADTAGIVETKDLILKEGVNRSRLYLRRADLVLLVLDGNQRISKEDRILIEELKDRPTIAVVNKSDLPQRIALARVKEVFSDGNMVCVSALKGTNLPSLEKAIIKMVWRGKVLTSQESLITNVRHKNLLEKAVQSLENAQESLKKSLSEEFIAIDLRETMETIGQITGQTVTEDLLDRIFSEFCIGK